MRVPKTIWVTWERHRRTHELCRALDVRLFELTSRRSSPFKYPSLLWRTLVCLLRERPATLFVQCPSVLLGMWVSLLKPLLGYRLIADLHNEAVEPINSSSMLYQAAFRHIRNVADLSLVTNEPLKEIVDADGGRGFVLPDKVPDIAPAQQRTTGALRPQVVFVCTYAVDEPVVEMVEAARLVGPSLDWHVTGDRRKASPDLQVPPHVRLTGFLPEREYEQLLRDADVIVDLTTLENCLVCGAYEAVALEKPLVTSDTQALRRYFRLEYVYATHDAPSLAASIRAAVARRQTLAAEMSVLKRELRDAWSQQRDTLRDRLGLLPTGSPEGDMA